MSAPNANAPNEGIVGQIANSVSNAANYVSESLQGKSAEASKEANKEQAKGNVPGNDSITDRVSGALGAASDKAGRDLVPDSQKSTTQSTMDKEIAEARRLLAAFDRIAAKARARFVRRLVHDLEELQAEDDDDDGGVPLRWVDGVALAVE